MKVGVDYDSRFVYLLERSPSASTSTMEITEEELEDYYRVSREWQAWQNRIEEEMDE